MTNDVGKGDRWAVTLLLGFISLVGCVLERPGTVGEADASASESDATEPLDGGAKADKPKPPAESSDGGKGPVEKCAVSFIKDVLPAFEAAGCGATACHGTRFGPKIRIEVNDIDVTYEELTTFAIGGKPYVKVGSADLEASTIHCHLAGKCGVKMPPRGEVPPALVQAVDRWVACGAPKN